MSEKGLKGKMASAFKGGIPEAAKAVKAVGALKRKIGEIRSGHDEVDDEDDGVEEMRPEAKKISNDPMTRQLQHALANANIRFEREGKNLVVRSDILGMGDKYVLMVKREGEYARTWIPGMKDFNGNYMFAREFQREEPRRIDQAIPLNALGLPKNAKITIEVEITLMADSPKSAGSSQGSQVGADEGATETFHADISVPTTVEIDSEPYKLHDWYAPVIDLFAYMSLCKNGKYDPAEIKGIIKLVKKLFDDEVAGRFFLKERLKEDAKNKEALSLAKICDAINQRGYERKVKFAMATYLMVFFIKPNFGVDVGEQYLQVVTNALHLNHEDVSRVASKYDVQEYDKTGERSKANQGSGANQGQGGNSSGSSAGWDESAQSGTYSYQNNYGGTAMLKDSDWARSVLGVGREAGAEEMRKAYRKKMSRCHPDKHASDPVAVRESFKMEAQDLNHAKNILGI